MRDLITLGRWLTSADSSAVAQFCRSDVGKKRMAAIEKSPGAKARLLVHLLDCVAIDVRHLPLRLVNQDADTVTFCVGFFGMVNFISPILTLPAGSPMVVELDLAIQRNLNSRMSKAARKVSKLRKGELLDLLRKQIEQRWSSVFQSESDKRRAESKDNRVDSSEIIAAARAAADLVTRPAEERLQSRMHALGSAVFAPEFATLGYLGILAKFVEKYVMPAGAPHKCRFCGSPSWYDPSDQSPPPDYCHESDHGEPECEADRLVVW